MKQINTTFLSPDGSDGAAEVDPLSQAVGDVDTSFPVLFPDKIRKFSITKCTKETSEKGSDTLRMKIRLEEEWKFRDGKAARVGYSFMQGIAVTPTENYDTDSIKRNVAMWAKALLDPEKAKRTSVRDIISNPNMFEGLHFNGRTGVKKDKNGVYPDQTQVTPVLEA